MSLVTSGERVVVIVLDEDEADYLGMVLDSMLTEEGRALVDQGPLYSLHSALVPTGDDNE